VPLRAKLSVTQTAPCWLGRHQLQELQVPKLSMSKPKIQTTFEIIFDKIDYSTSYVVDCDCSGFTGSSASPVAKPRADPLPVGGTLKSATERDGSYQR
jgi:hypothetical protein